MKSYAHVIYRGPEVNLGRFGIVKAGDRLPLTQTEYLMVEDDPDYEFVEWTEAPQRLDAGEEAPAVAEESDEEAEEVTQKRERPTPRMGQKRR